MSIMMLMWAKQPYYGKQISQNVNIDNREDTQNNNIIVKRTVRMSILTIVCTKQLYYSK